MRYLAILIVLFTAAGCTWRDAQGVRWYGETADARAARYEDLLEAKERLDRGEALIYWEGAYAAYMVHNLRVFKARGADMESDTVFNLADAMCVATANEVLDMLGPGKWAFPQNIPSLPSQGLQPSPSPTPCDSCT